MEQSRWRLGGHTSCPPPGSSASRGPRGASGGPCGGSRLWRLHGPGACGDSWARRSLSLSLSLPVKMTGAPAAQPRRWWHGQNGDTCRAAGGFLAGRSGAAQSQEAAWVAVRALARQSCRCPRAKGASGYGWRVELSPQRCSQQLSGCLVPGGTGEGPAGGWSLGQRAPRRSSRPRPAALRGNQARCGFVLTVCCRTSSSCDGPGSAFHTPGHRRRRRPPRTTASRWLRDEAVWPQGRDSHTPRFKFP